MSFPRDGDQFIESVMAAETAAPPVNHGHVSAQVIRLVPKSLNQAPPTPESVVAFLRDLLANIENGTVKPTGLVVHYLDAASTHVYWRWGMSQLEHLGLLAAATTQVCQEPQE